MTKVFFINVIYFLVKFNNNSYKIFKFEFKVKIHIFGEILSNFLQFKITIYN
jgi:hypothetical protein